MNKENSSLFTNCLLSQKTSVAVCPRHKGLIGNHFCVGCLSYSICSACAHDEHVGHQVLEFGSVQQNKESTKTILLEALEETLKHLKQRENQVKNSVAELQLIRSSFKNLQSQVTEMLTALINHIRKHVQQIVQTKQDKLEQQLQDFYHEYNGINDDLRDNLIQIMDGGLDILKFNRSAVVMEPPPCPNFQTYKLTIEKSKKKLKTIIQQIRNVEDLLAEGSGNCTQAHKTSTLSKYIDRCQVTEKVNQSFMRTINLLDKENMPLLNLSRSRK